LHPQKSKGQGQQPQQKIRDAEQEIHRRNQQVPTEGMAVQADSAPEGKVSLNKRWHALMAAPEIADRGVRRLVAGFTLWTALVVSTWLADHGMADRPPALWIPPVRSAWFCPGFEHGAPLPGRVGPGT